MHYLRHRIFFVWSKIQKLNSKSSTHSEVIAVSDGMNNGLWIHRRTVKQHRIDGYKNTVFCADSGIPRYTLSAYVLDAVG
jgi:hypothetical protein